jgi:aminopeptidase N
MLKTFEGYFGKYPFYQDGYKLVETPYWGMEHQSCVAYGNNYENNRFGFDFIIVHESGHEWFGNSITAYDKADMWIHEGFTTYSEALFVEKQYGKARSVQYLLGQKGNIKNATAMVGKPFANMKHPDNDIYYKGAWMLHTMRSILDNDTLWFNTLKDLNRKFYHKIVKGTEVENFISARTNYDFKPLFNQYLRHAELPVFEYFIVNKNGLNELYYHINANVKTLRLPIKVALSKGNFDFVMAEKKWQVYDLPYISVDDFKVDEQHFLINVKKIAIPEKLK